MGQSFQSRLEPRSSQMQPTGISAIPKSSVQHRQGTCAKMPFAHPPNANYAAPSTPAHVRHGGYFQEELSSGLRWADSSSAGGRCSGSGRQEISLPCTETRRPLTCEVWDSHSCIDEDSGALGLDTSSIGKRFMANRNI